MENVKIDIKRGVKPAPKKRFTTEDLKPGQIGFRKGKPDEYYFLETGDDALVSVSVWSPTEMNFSLHNNGEAVFDIDEILPPGSTIYVTSTN